MYKRNAAAPANLSFLLGAILFLVALPSSALSQGKLSRVTFFKSENSYGNNVLLYVDGNYVGSLGSRLESYEFDCDQPPNYLPTVELPAGTHYLRFKYKGADYGPEAFTLSENVCIKYQIHLPALQQAYYDDSGYYEDDYNLLEVLLGTVLAFVLLWAAGVF